MLPDFFHSVLAHLRSSGGEWKQTLIVTHSFGQAPVGTALDGICEWILRNVLTKAEADGTIEEPVKPLCSHTKEEE